MVLIQINLPKHIDQWLDIEDAKRGIKNKRITLVKILEELVKNES